MEKISRYDTNANVNFPICIFYNQQISLGTSGTLSLRKGFKTGEVIETFNVGSNKLLANAYELIIQPTNPLPYCTKVYVTVSNKFIVSTMNGGGFTGLEETGNDEFYFSTEDALGKPFAGGTVIHKNDTGYYLIAAPQNTEINGSWNEISNLIAKVSEQTETTGWYLPSIYEMQNLIFNNKRYWINEENENENENQNDLYWTNTEVDSLNAHIIRMSDSIPQVTNKEYFYKIRLFKKVLY